ncbi:MAG: YceI family protein [Acidimicrobiales bacterium]
MNHTTALPTGTWTIDPSTTTVTVTVTKLGVFTVPATLTVVSGTIEIDDDHDVTAVHVAVDAGSYASKNAKRNEHVVGPDFLDAANNPTIEFRADRVEPGPNGFTSNGTVTIRGTSSPIDVTISDVAVDGTTGSFTAAAVVDRNAIGVDKMPTFVIGRLLTLTVDARATRSPSE